MSSIATPTTADRQWFIVGRWQEFDGESRANLLRIIAIGAFYGVELVNYEWWGASPPEFHRGATAIAVGWVLLALGILLCLRRRFFPMWLKYAATAVDITLLTSVAFLGAGPNSPLVYGYFLLIVLAALRFSLPLVWVASGGAIVGYLALLGFYDRSDTWFDGEHLVPPHEQLIVLVSLALAGVFVGQVVRRARLLAEDYAQRLRAATGESST